MNTFGLPNPQKTADPAAVDDALEKNGQTIMQTVAALVKGPTDAINANSDILAKVQKRLVNSVNGHINKNTGLLRPVIGALYDTVNNRLSENQAILNAVGSDPSVAEYLRSSPQPPSIAPIIAQLPAGYAGVPPGAGPSLSPPSTPGAVPPPSPPGSGPPGAPPQAGIGGQLWAVAIDCRCAGIIALGPFRSVADMHPLPAPYTDWTFVEPLSLPQSQIAAWLEANGPSILASRCPPAGQPGGYTGGPECPGYQAPPAPQPPVPVVQPGPGGATVGCYTVWIWHTPPWPQPPAFAKHWGELPYIPQQKLYVPVDSAINPSSVQAWVRATYDCAALPKGTLPPSLLAQILVHISPEYVQVSFPVWDSSNTGYLFPPGPNVAPS